MVLVWITCQNCLKSLCFKGVQIGSSLKKLAERRIDVFSSEETVIGRKVCMYKYVIYSSCTYVPYNYCQIHLLKTGDNRY